MPHFTERGGTVAQLEDEVRKLISERYGTVAAFARAIDVADRTVYSALRKGLQNTTFSTIMPICNGLGIDPDDISRGHLTSLSRTRKPVFVPLYGSIVAGKPIDPAQAEDLFPIPAELHAAYPNAFMLRVRGNSMNKVLPDGFLALVDPCDSIDVSGKVYAVTVGDHEATIKRVELHDNGLTLVPESSDPTYKPLLFDYGTADVPRIAAVGRVV
jgi:repressor LexA